MRSVSTPNDRPRRALLASAARCSASSDLELGRTLAAMMLPNCAFVPDSRLEPCVKTVMGACIALLLSGFDWEERGAAIDCFRCWLCLLELFVAFAVRFCIKGARREEDSLGAKCVEVGAKRSKKSGGEQTGFLVVSFFSSPSHGQNFLFSSFSSAFSIQRCRSRPRFAPPRCCPSTRWCPWGIQGGISRGLLRRSGVNRCEEIELNLFRQRCLCAAAALNEPSRH